MGSGHDGLWGPCAVETREMADIKSGATRESTAYYRNVFLSRAEDKGATA